MAARIISWSFYILFFFTPLFFNSLTNELFEYNKMMLVYVLTVIIVSAWIFKIIHQKSSTVIRTPLDIPLLLFWLSQVISTILSIDAHTSLWGYYSRSNGGLLSITSYILLYFAFVSNFDASYIPRFFKAMLLGGLLVSIYAISEHFGVSPSCIILTGQATADCWVQDVQARVFATLGQPNWLAAYLAMLIFPALYFFLQSKTKLGQIFFYCLLITFYLAFTFTYSRGGSLGLIGGFVVFALGLLFWQLNQKKGLQNALWRPFFTIILTFFIINLLFGSALYRFQLIKPSTFAPQTASGSAAPSGVTQLENGGTESAQIRLIVWKGALEIFKHYPIFGSGVETFAYSYYNFRPLEHNLVSEWDFLYNKAHNEYLNYLATTGIVGFGAYTAVILVFIAWCFKKVFGKKHPITHHPLLITSFLASYSSYLVQNFFGFSVVIVALFFYLLPAMIFIYTGATAPLKLPNFLNFIYKKILILIIVHLLLWLITLGLLFNIARFYLADTFYKLGNDYAQLNNLGKSYNYLLAARSLNSSEPLYHSDLGFAAASVSVAYFGEDATKSAKLKDESIEETNIALDLSPKNVSVWRTAIRTYYQLSSVDPQYIDKTIEVLDHAIKLAPTDAKLYYNKGLILAQAGKNQEGIQALQKSVDLKPNYWEAHFAIGQIYEAMGNQKDAKQAYENVLKILPNEPETLKKLEGLK